MFDGKSIFVTGGTGSFGRRFIRTVLERYRPRRVVVFSRDAEGRQAERDQNNNNNNNIIAPLERLFNR